MGLWGFIKSLLGFKEEEAPPVYNPPYIVIPGKQKDTGSYWEQRRNQWQQQMAAERARRSKYGGF